MLSFRQLVDSHAPVLLLDAASARIQVGLAAGPGRTRWESSDAEAGTGLFGGIETLGADPDAMGSFAFCEGPGSMLGIRTAAMALRVWCGRKPRPVFGYFSLVAAAHALGDPDASLIADARRDSWHVYRLGGKLRRVPTGELPEGRLLMPDGFRQWTPLAARNFARTPYAPAAIFGHPAGAAAAIFRPVAEPDAFRDEEPRYATWTPAVHRAP